MTKNEIIGFLRDKQSYLKKGKEWLATKFNVSEELIEECKYAIKEQGLDNVNDNLDFKSKAFANHLESNGLDISDVKSVKFWQSASGEQRYSIVTMNQWHEMPTMKEEILSFVKEYSPEVPKINYKKVHDPTMCEISLPDIHYGKITGEGPEALERHYLRAIIDLHKKSSGVNIDRFVLPIGNDGMNSEGYSKATTKGTPQEDYMGWRQSFRGYWKLVAKSIDYLSKYAPVDVIIVQGNHDFERMFYAGEVLAALYSNNKNVNINNSFDIRKYYEYGVNMLMFTHGDRVKSQEMPLLMATEQPLMWSRTKFREAHCGHVHKEMLNEYMGTKVRFIPSICGNDEWHKSKGYVGTMRVGQAHLWNKHRGYEGYVQSNVINYAKEV